MYSDKEEFVVHSLKNKTDHVYFTLLQ